VDYLFEMIVSAPTREELVARCRALDRVLQWGFYLIPNWHIASWRIAYWNHFGMPKVQAPYALGAADTWWDTPAKK
jgi:microcin C transport system substrate-binding protein